MDIKQKLASIKKILFADVPGASAAAPGGKEYPLADGTKVMISDLSTGGTVTISGAPAPDGDYELQDGTVISVAGGMITAITPDATPDVPGAPPASDFTSKFSEIDAKFSSYEQKFAGYETRIAAAEDVIKKQQEINKQLFEVVEKLAEVPVDNTPEPHKNNFASHPAESREQRVQALGAAFKKFKKDNA